LGHLKEAFEGVVGPFLGVFSKGEEQYIDFSIFGKSGLNYQLGA
jgi:hypothetical protein